MIMLLWPGRNAVLLTALIGISASAWAVAPNVVPSPVPSSPTEMMDLLKAAVVNSQAQLGTLDAVAKRIFDEEVVPQYPLFVRDYKRVGDSVNAEVDLDGIRNTVRFTAQKSLNQPSPKILLYLDADSHCPKCLDDVSLIKRHMQLRMERRGFTVVWLTTESLSGTPIADLVGPRSAAGYLQMTLIPAPQDDVESAHADEKRFIAKTRLEIRSIASYQDQAEIFDTGSFEVETQKLLTHALIELGARADLASMNIASKDDLVIQLGGITGFAQYARLKSSIQSRLKGIAVVDERRLSRGQAILALKTKKSVEEVKTLLNGVGSGEDQAIQMEIHP